jgi:hypothetical protein
MLFAQAKVPFHAAFTLARSRTLSRLGETHLQTQTAAINSFELCIAS